jgi:hypothetical protein
MSLLDDVAIAVAVARENSDLTGLLDHAIEQLVIANVPLTPLLENWQLHRALEKAQRREEVRRRVRKVLDAAATRASTTPGAADGPSTPEAAVAVTAQRFVDALPLSPARRVGGRRA